MYQEELSQKRNDIIAEYVRYRVTPDVTNKLHKHPHCELVIILSGDMTYSTGGKIARVGEKSIVYNRAGLIHNPFVKQTPIYERYKFKFFEEDLLFGKSDNTLSNALGTSYTKALGDEDFEEIYSMAKSIWRAKNLKDDSRVVSEYALSCLRSIILHAAMSVEREQDKNDGYIADVVDYINKNLNMSLTIGKIAASFFVSKSKLIYDFKDYCNMNINEYITMGRVEKAKGLLSRGYSVVSVAEACGFSSASYFIKVFASLVGTTPLQYQIRHSRGI